MPAKHRIRLTADERTHLRSLTRSGTTSARRLARARVLLLADEHRADRTIADAVGLHERSIARIRRRAVEEGVVTALEDRPRPGAAPKLDERQEAHLIALACSDPPDGRSQWSMQLLADQLVIELEDLETISDETVRRILKKKRSSRGANSAGVSPL